MNFADILHLALRNLREAKLRAALTIIGVTIGVAVIVTMISFGLGLQRNTVERFRDLDLFNEIQVYGRSLGSIIERELNKPVASATNEKTDNGRNRRDGTSRRSLDDAALEEIAGIPGVSSVEPNVKSLIFVRANGRVQQQLVSGVRAGNEASRFKNFAAGRMISAAARDEAVVDESFLTKHGFGETSAAAAATTAADVLGRTIEFLAPPSNTDLSSGSDAESAGEEGEAAAADELAEAPSFFGLPLNDEAGEPERAAAAARPLGVRTFRIVGLLKNEIAEGRGGRRRFRGIMPEANIYIPLDAANEWAASYRGTLDQVALTLARQGGVIAADQNEGYESATLRVEDPAAVKNVVERLNKAGFSAYGLFSELDEIRTFFLVVQSTLGLLGGISLVVASFGIANTMIMSILERTREIGIMKAIGAEDREIKLIFFVEAGVIGLLGGVVGSLSAWGLDNLANRLVYEFILKPRGEMFINFFALPPYLWLGAILFAMVISVAAALYPAARAARIDPVEALRHD